MFIGHLGCETEMPSRCGGCVGGGCQNRARSRFVVPSFQKEGTTGSDFSSIILILTHPRGNMFRECQGTRKRGGARYSLLFVGVRFCSSLFGFCSSLFGFVRHCLVLFVIVRHCSSLFGQTRGSAPTRGCSRSAMQKKFGNFFCISLTYSYLWLRRRYLRSEMKRKKVLFSFAFRSLIRTFARE